MIGLPVCTLLKLLDRCGISIRIKGEAWPELERCHDCADHARRARQAS